MKMIVQGEAMIPQSEPVALTLEGVGDQVSSELLAQTLNFLRCGVIAVQWILVENWDGMEGKRSAIEFLDNLHDRLIPLQQPSERFTVQTPFSTGHPQWLRGAAITLTRTVEPEVEETTFANLCGTEEFYQSEIGDPERRRYVKVLGGQAGSQRGLAVIVGQKGFGHPRIFEPSCPVLKILK